MDSIKGPIMSKLSDLFTQMKCNKRTIFWLLMQSYKPSTWIALVVKEHLLDLEMLQAFVFSLFSCVTLVGYVVRWIRVPSFSLSMEHSLGCAGGVSSLFQSHKKPKGSRGSSC